MKVGSTVQCCRGYLWAGKQAKDSVMFVGQVTRETSSSWFVHSSSGCEYRFAKSSLEQVPRSKSWLIYIREAERG